MPIIKSAKKRVRVSNKANARNVELKSSLRSAMKSFQASLTSKKNVAEAHAKAQSELDKAAKKGLLHKNKVARKKTQLSKAAQAAGVKPEKKATTKKAAPAKTTTKKAVAKKPVAKKTTTKK